MPRDSEIAKLKWSPKTISIKAGAGLTLSVYPKGRRVWLLRVVRQETPGGPWKGITRSLGTWPEMSVKKAQRVAAEFRRGLRAGITPEIAGTGPSVRVFAQRYLAEVVADRRKDVRPVERWLKREILPVLGQKAVKAVTPADVQAIVFRKRDAGAKCSAAALLGLLKRFFDYAVVCGIVELNPTRRTPLKTLGRRQPKQRVLEERELKLIMRPGSKYPMGARMWVATQLIILTLCRKSELLGACWGWVDWEASTLEVPSEASKSGKPHVVYLSCQAVALLRLLRCLPLPYSACADPAVCIFPSQMDATRPVNPATLNKALERVKWGMPHFTPHDLRRTGCTMLYELDYKSEWIEKAMNHVVPGVKGIYNKAQYGDERRKMLQAWADWLERLRDGDEK